MSLYCNSHYFISSVLASTRNCELVLINTHITRKYGYIIPVLVLREYNLCQLQEERPKT